MSGPMDPKSLARLCALAHSDDPQDFNVWDIIRDDLPLLLAEAARLLDQRDEARALAAGAWKFLADERGAHAKTADNFTEYAEDATQRLTALAEERDAVMRIAARAVARLEQRERELDDPAGTVAEQVAAQLDACRAAAASLYGEKDAARLYPPDVDEPGWTGRPQERLLTAHQLIEDYGEGHIDGAALDAAWPPCGGCALCGDPDARHRIFDAIASRHRAGESVVELAEDFKVSADAVRLALAHREGGA